LCFAFSSLSSSKDITKKMLGVLELKIPMILSQEITINLRSITSTLTITEVLEYYEEKLQRAVLFSFSTRLS
ncbi:unnamed protein product, partial [Heterotrigona itama]